MSFFDTISNLLERFMSENIDMDYENFANELFNIEGDINKIYNMKNTIKKFRENIDIIFSKHILNKTIYEIHNAKFQKLKCDICDIYKVKKVNNTGYYDELIKIDRYNIED
jgi:hypothetical protein